MYTQETIMNSFNALFEKEVMRNYLVFADITDYVKEAEKCNAIKYLSMSELDILENFRDRVQKLLDNESIISLIYYFTKGRNISDEQYDSYELYGETLKLFKDFKCRLERQDFDTALDLLTVREQEMHIWSENWKNRDHRIPTNKEIEIVCKRWKVSKLVKCKYINSLKDEEYWVCSNNKGARLIDNWYEKLYKDSIRLRYYGMRLLINLIKVLEKQQPFDGESDILAYAIFLSGVEKGAKKKEYGE